MEPSSQFLDKVALRYSKKTIDNEDAYQYKLKKTREYFQPTNQVLEIGCGTGTTAIQHAPFVEHILATDISAKMLGIANEKAKVENVGNVTFKQSSIESLSLDDASMDVVLGLSVLHLLEDKEAAIKHVFQILKPGGVFVTSTVCLGDNMKFFKYIAPIGKFLRLMPLVKIFTAKELESSLKGVGFEIDYIWQPEKSMAVFIIAKKN